MTKCTICKKHEAKFKVRDKKTNKIIYLCEWCEEKPTYELIEKIEPKEKPTEELGRLHEVNSTRKIAVCRMCNNEIPLGSKCYNQSIKVIPFPIPSKVCSDCGKKLIKLGYKVAPKK